MEKNILRKFAVPLLSIGFLALGISTASAGTITELISVSTDGVAADKYSVVESKAAISADGNIVVFSSAATNLAPSATGWALYRRDRAASVTEMITNNTGSGSGHAVVSADGMTTAVTSGGAIWAHDYATASEEMISVNIDGLPGNNCGTCGWTDDCNGCEQSSANTSPSISADGRFVAFASFSSDLVENDTYLTNDVFVRDRLTGTTEIVSVIDDGTYIGGSSPSISSDGRYIAFTAKTLNNVNGQVYIHDRVTGTTDIVSQNSDGISGNFGGSEPAISGDGSLVAFTSASTNLTRSDGNGPYVDVFVKDVVSGDIISLTSKLASGGSTPSISEDGNWVTYESANKMYVISSNGGKAKPLNIDNNGTEVPGMSFSASLNADGSVVALSGYPSLVPEDTNNDKDVYVRDMNGGIDPTTTCSDYTDQGTCEANSCRWSNKKATCR